MASAVADFTGLQRLAVQGMSFQVRDPRLLTFLNAVCADTLPDVAACMKCTPHGATVSASAVGL